MEFPFPKLISLVRWIHSLFGSFARFITGGHSLVGNATVLFGFTVNKREGYLAGCSIENHGDPFRRGINVNSNNFEF